MKLEGSLDAFSLPDIFALLSMTKKTGGLHLSRSGGHGVVWFTTGSVTGGASDVSRLLLARRLVGAGDISDDDLRGAVDRANTDEGVGVAMALQQAGSVDEASLHDVVGEHIVDTVFDLLRWQDGAFTFVVDEPNPDDVGVSRPVDDLVAEARRRLDEWGSVSSVVPSPQTVLSLALNPTDDPALSRDEWALVALVDGHRPVGEIVSLCGKGEFAVVTALAALVSRGLLRVGDADGVTALLRRHDLLSRLEGANGSGADEADADDDDDIEHAEAAALAPVDVDMTTPAPQQMRRQPRSAEPPEVSPRRPEPFLPPRQPVHAEDPMPVAMAGGGGVAAAAPEPSHLIDRDPSVNKSLLLRLIAGVRGL